MEQQPPLAEYFASCCLQQKSCRRWVVGLSGGLDSVVLLYLAAQVLPSRTLHVLHINHQLQADAHQWQHFCAELCASLALPFTAIKVNPANNSESAARDARYQAFADFLQAGDFLLLGHHADDQAETLIYRLSRGAGLRGLGGIPQQRPLGLGQLLRPLLPVSRRDLQAFAASHALQWVEDPSNQVLTYDRNFIRHQILAPLQTRWPGVETRFAAAAQLLQQEQQLLDQYLDAELAAAGVSAYRFDLDAVGDRERVRLQALLRRWIFRISAELLNRVTLDTICNQMLAAGADRTPELSIGSWRLRRYRKALYLNRVQSSPLYWPVFTSGAHRLAHGVLEVTAGVQGLRIRAGVDYEWHPACDIQSCQPVGRPRKVMKKLFQEAGVPPWQRPQWPVLLSGQEVAAVAGLCVCEGWAATGEAEGFMLDWTPC